VQADDLEAINRYVMTAPAKTPEAGKLRDDWAIWWTGLSWWDKNTDEGIYAQGRNRRNAFTRANAVTPEEKAAAELAIREGVTTEEMTGGVRESTSTGDYAVVQRYAAAKFAVAAGLAGAVLALWLTRK
jgi:carbohydrate-binding DOMON domain-containing protein